MYDNTPAQHPDSALLPKAMSVVHELALRINTVQAAHIEEQRVQTLKTLEELLQSDVRPTNASI